ncbi:MAG: indole-3-glycerol-phosphate synthase TrpC, partial [Alphaproteobacteria bacterium]
MSGLLDEICQAKRRYVAARKKEVPLAALEEAAGSISRPRSLIQSLRAARAAGRFGLICEIKRLSPSAGRLCRDLDVAALAQSYAKGGAASLSV